MRAGDSLNRRIHDEFFSEFPDRRIVANSVIIFDETKDLLAKAYKTQFHYQEISRIEKTISK